MDVTVLFRQLLIFAGMMAVGYFCMAKGFMTPEFNSRLSAMVVNIFIPVTILSGACGKDTAEAAAMMIPVALLNLGYYIVTIPLSAFAVRLLGIEPEKRLMYRLLMIFNNIAFMGIPIASGLYGTGSLVLIAVSLSVQFLFLYTYAPMALSGKASLKLIVNPGFIGAIIAIIIISSGVKVPETCAAFLTTMGNAAVPLAMMLIGASLYKADLRPVLRDRKTLAAIAVKLVIVPIIYIIAVKPLGLVPLTRGIFAIVCAAPPAAAIALMINNSLSEELGQEASAVLAVETVLSIVTMPLAAMFV